MQLGLSESMTIAFEISSTLLVGSRSHSNAAFLALRLAVDCGLRREKSSRSTNSNRVSTNFENKSSLSGKETPSLELCSGSLLSSSVSRDSRLATLACPLRPKNKRSFVPWTSPPGHFQRIQACPNRHTCNLGTAPRKGIRLRSHLVSTHSSSRFTPALQTRASRQTHNRNSNIQTK